MDKLPNSNDPYVVLNIKYSDSKKTVKRAYVKLIKKYKPEKYPKEFKKIRAAYEQILKSRKHYSTHIDKDEPVEQKSEPENPILSDQKEANQDPKTAEISNEVVTDENPKKHNEIILSSPWTSLESKEKENKKERDENEDKNDNEKKSDTKSQSEIEDEKKQQLHTEDQHEEYTFNWQGYAENVNNNDEDNKEEPHTEDQQEKQEYIFNWQEDDQNNENQELHIENQNEEIVFGWQEYSDDQNNENQEPLTEDEEYVFNWQEYSDDQNNENQEPLTEDEEYVFNWQEYSDDQNEENQEPFIEDPYKEIVFNWQEHNENQNNENQEPHTENKREEIVFNWQEHNENQNNENQEPHTENKREEIIFNWQEHKENQNNENQEPHTESKREEIVFNWQEYSDNHKDNQENTIWREYSKNVHNTNNQEEPGFFSLGKDFPSFQDVYNIWLDEKEATILRLIELFPYNEKTYIFAFLISEIAGDKLEHSSKWLKLAINKGINISHWIEEVLYEYEIIKIANEIFSWEQLCLIKSKSSAKKDLKRYVHLLLYYEKYSTAALLIDNDTFFQDTWDFPSLDLVEIALEISCALAWYLPKTGKAIFQKYSGALVTDIELAVSDMYSLYPAWLKTEQHYPRLIAHLKRFLSLSSSSIEDIDIVILELYISIIKNKNKYSQLLLFMKQQNPQLLQFILSQIEQHSQQQVISNIPKSVEKKTLTYLFAKNSIYNKVSEVLTVFLGFFVIGGGVTLIAHILALFLTPFRLSHLFIIFATPLIVLAAARAIDVVEKYGYKKWLRPNLVNLATSTPYDLSLINDNEKINIKFDSEEDISLIVLQQLSLLGARFLDNNFDINTILDALTYEKTRPKGLKMHFLSIFSQIEIIKVFEDEPKINKKIIKEQKENLLSIHNELQKSPKRFAREMTIIAKRHMNLHNHYKIYLRKLTKKIQKPQKRFPHQKFNQPAFIIAAVIGIVIEFLLFQTTKSSILPKTIAFVLPMTFISFFVARQLIYNFKIRPLMIKFIMQTKITPEQLKKSVTQKDLVNHVQDDKVLQSICWTSRVGLLYEESNE